MKTLLLLIIYQFVSLHSYCQLDTNSIHTLESILRNEHPNGTLYYTDRLDSGFIKRIRESLKRRKFIGGPTSSNTYATVRLSKKEKKYLDSSLNKFYSNFWQDTLFKNSKRIPVDSMWARIQKQNREFHKNRIRDTTEAALINSIRKEVENANTFQFSPLIYFRNKSIFISFFVRLCGNTCGVDELSFYKLENGIYKKWFLISGGVF